jgi:hypothetical protein
MGGDKARMKYHWVKMTRNELLEFIDIGDPFCFRYDGKDYFIQGHNFDGEAKGRVGFYYIQDPIVRDNGSHGYTESHYPESMKAKSSEDLLTMPFLDGKTIFERFDELRFFDT